MAFVVFMYDHIFLPQVEDNRSVTCFLCLVRLYGHGGGRSVQEAVDAQSFGAVVGAVVLFTSFCVLCLPFCLFFLILF